MGDFFTDHPLLALAAAVCLAAILVPLRASRGRHGERIRMTVYCLHCNWEGKVVRHGGRCGRCGSENLTVLAV